MKAKTKIWLVAAAALLVVVLALAGIKAGQIGSMISAGKSFKPPPESVSTAEASVGTWEATRTAVGSLVAVRGVTLGAEVTGTVRAIGFESGAEVRKGAMLVRLDTSQEEAQLAAARAEAALARVGLDRARALREGGASAQSDLDAAEARAKGAEAAAAALEAAIAKKTIRAPFDGRIAIRQVELGQVVSPGTAVASLQSVSPIHADFWLPQQALAGVKIGQKVRLTTDTFPDDHWEGAVAVVNPEVDPSTRNVRVRATFENPDGRLRPGMFAAVEVVGTLSKRVLMVPATSVLFAPYGDSIYVVEEKKEEGGKVTGVARQRFVRTGERRGDFVAVTSGLNAGETVVSSGAFKLRPGVAVVVNNALAPAASLTPKPADN